MMYDECVNEGFFAVKECNFKIFVFKKEEKMW